MLDAERLKVTSFFSLGSGALRSTLGKTITAVRYCISPHADCYDLHILTD